jgi:hypothetical protein
MRYIHVRWVHENPEYPVDLYSELDGDSWEVRKVEVFADGRLGYADAEESSGPTGLGLEPVPPLEEIARDPEFVPREIARSEFERLWAIAHPAGLPR